MAKFSSTIKLHGVEMEIVGTYERGCSGDYWHPGDPDECEVDKVLIGGVNVADLINACDLWDAVQEAAHEAVFVF